MVGVPYAMIMQDYLSSMGNIGSEIVEATRLLMRDRVGQEISSGALNAIISVEPDYIDASFTAVERQYGSFENIVHAASD
ncbi:tyrosine-protein phosphatase [Sphingobium sp. 15-1]|uniref:tyrosine-protein phosphatase n=1 Tax=Sphingobium sp. 15-1 TaxID=2729616 RepID=UPI0035106BDE